LCRVTLVPYVGVKAILIASFNIDDNNGDSDDDCDGDNVREIS
jgi:hypothetical protein